MDTRIQYEQEVLFQKESKIRKQLEYLSRQSTKTIGKAEQLIAQRRKERINAIKNILNKPYLGRMDIVSEDGGHSVYYVGTLGVHDYQNQEEIVIDWRSEFGKLYTSFSGGARSWPGLGVLTGKRVINIENMEVKRVTDVGKVIGSNETNNTSNKHFRNISNDEFLADVLSATSNDYKLNEIISSLQEEQDAIIRLPMDQQIVIQGVAGSGKSSVAMHRISYLLFNYKDHLSPEQIIVIAPNKMFISFLEPILSELDINGIKQDTFGDFALNLLSSKNIRSIEKSHSNSLIKQIDSGVIDKEMEGIVKFKGSMAFKSILKDLMDVQKEQILPVGDIEVNNIRIPYSKIKELHYGYRYLPINTCREKMIDSVNKLIEDIVKSELDKLEQQFEMTHDHWVKSLPTNDPYRKSLNDSLEYSRDNKKKGILLNSKAAKEKFRNEYKKLDAVDVYRSIFDKTLLMTLSPTLSEKLVDNLINHQSTFGYEDLAALLYIQQRLHGKDIEYKYMVVDEAQDCSPFQLYMLRQYTKSITILGDITQSIYQDGIQSWDEFDQSVLGTNIKKMYMNTSYRSTYEIMTTANLVIQNSKLSLPTIIPVNRMGGQPVISRVHGGNELLERLMDSLNQFRKKNYHKVAIIGKDLHQTKGIYNQLVEHGVENIQLIDNDTTPLSGKIILMPSYLVKGMEFDAVIIPNVNDQRFSLNPIDAKLLFICITRAHHELHIYFHGTISPLLDGLTINSSQNNETDLAELL